MLATLALLTGFFASARAAEIPAALDLGGAIELARARSPELDTHRQAIAAAEAGKLSAVGAFLPYLSASGGYTRIPTETFSIGGQTFSSPNENYTLGANASLPLFAGFRNVAGLDRSRASEDAAVLGHARAEETVALAAAQAFVAVLKAEALWQVSLSNVSRSEQQLERVEALHEVGSVPPVDVYRQRGQLGSDRLEELSARNAVEAARNDLNVRLGIAVDDRRPLQAVEVESLASVEATSEDLNVLVERARLARADLQAARANQRGADASLRSSRSGYWPTLDLNLNYSWNGVDPPGGFDELDEGDSYSLGLSLNVPIFDRFITRAGVQQAQANVVYQAAVRESLTREVARQVASAHLNVRNAVERVSLSDANLKSAREELRLAEERYNVGAGTLLERNVAAASLTAAETNRITALYDLLYARIALAATLGEPVESWGVSPGRQEL